MYYLSRWYHFALDKLYTRLRLRGASEAKVATFAALALLSLNLHARAGKNAYPIYRLKTQFIRWLYYHGYCTGKRIVKQSNPGRDYTLYEFTFEIFDVRYIWHLPYQHVDWGVGTLSDDKVSAYVPTIPPAASLAPRQVTTLLACLCAALELLGERPVYQETLSHAIKKTLRQFFKARPY